MPLRTGRSTDDRKGESIRIRLSDDMRTYVTRKASIEGVSISEIFRRYIAADMKQSSTYQGGRDGDDTKKRIAFLDL